MHLLSFETSSQGCYGLMPQKKLPFSLRQQPCHALGSALPMAGTGPTPGAGAHSLTWQNEGELHSKSEESEIVPSLTPGKELFLHSCSNFSPIPLPTPVPSVAFLAGIATRIYSHYIMSQGEMPYHSSQKTQTELNLLQRQTKTRSEAKLVQANQHNNTVAESDKEKGRDSLICFHNKICICEHIDGRQFIHHCAVSGRYAATQTLATPIPVKRASSSSCRRGSRLCSSSIMAAETEPRLKKHCKAWWFEMGMT